MIERASSAADIWQTAQGELQLQLPRETFDTWLRNARLIAYEDGTYIIGVHNVYAREWLEHRLKKVVVRTVGRIARRTVEVRFVVAAENGYRARKRREHEAEEALRAGPLLAELQPPREEPPRFERLTPGETGLNPRQTFDTFAVGPCNQLAHVAASAIVESDATPFNPLYVHAGVGLGKTHLLHAIGNAAAACGRRALYVTSETFTNDLVGAIRSRSTGDFRSKYREVDVLLVDDVQFLAGKDSSQEEFYHTFNALLNANAQVVVAASAPPAEIPGLDPRLRSSCTRGRWRAGCPAACSSRSRWKCRAACATWKGRSTASWQPPSSPTERRRRTRRRPSWRNSSRRAAPPSCHSKTSSWPWPTPST